MQIRLEEGYMTVAEAAKRKGISRAAMYQAIKSNRIPHVKISGITTILAEKDVEAFTPRRRKARVDRRPYWEKIAELGRSIPPED